MLFREKQSLFIGEKTTLQYAVSAESKSFERYSLWLIKLLLLF
jgi:hypothetical protein